MRLKYALYYFLFSKFEFRKPLKKKILIYDNVGSKYLKNYFDRNDLEIMNTRILNESIHDFKDKKLNFFILFKMILNFEFSLKKYNEIYMKFLDPKFAFTMIDNNQGFYNIKNILPNCKTIFIQNAHRMALTDILSNKRLTNGKKNFRVDYMLVFNKYIGSKYKNFIKGKVIPIGSFISNSFPVKKKKYIKKYILYISNFRPVSDEKNFTTRTTWGDYKYNEEKLMRSIYTFIKNKKNIKIKILGTSYKHSYIEKKYFENFFGKNKFYFIPRYINRPTYKYIDNAEVVLSIDSTLGYTSFSRGTKTAFFSVRNNKKDFESTRLGWPSKKKAKTEIWTNSYRLSEVKRVISYLINLKKIRWFKIREKYLSDLMIYDSNNKKFLQLLNFLKI